MKPYEKLASLYEKDWGKFSLGYIDFLERIFKLLDFHPASILDIACGTGNLIGELYRRGYNVMGADISPEMLKIAKKVNPKVKFINEDMSKLALGKKFDVIVCPFDSINYLLSEKKLDRTFFKVYEHLNNKGLFVFDINTPKLYAQKHHGIIERDLDGITFKQILNYDPDKGLASTIFEFSPSEKEKHVQRAYTKKYIADRLSFYKYKIIGEYKNFTLEQADENSEKIFFVAARNLKLRPKGKVYCERKGSLHSAKPSTSSYVVDFKSFRAVE